MVLDVPLFRWSKWNSWITGKPPEAYEGHPIFAVDPLITVVVTDDFDLFEMRDWMAANIRHGFQRWGRWEFIEHQFRVDRTRLGFVVLFHDEDDAFFFKMRWV